MEVNDEVGNGLTAGFGQKIATRELCDQAEIMLLDLRLDSPDFASEADDFWIQRLPDNTSLKRCCVESIQRH